MNVEEYLDALASKASTPGGGAAAALSGAQAGALLQMVCNLTQGKRFADRQDKIVQLRSIASEVTTDFLHAMNQDQEAFQALMAVYREKASDDQREARLEKALQAAATPPLNMIVLVGRLVPVAEELANLGNPTLITDVGVAVSLLEATLESARLNVKINLKAIRDYQFKANANSRIAECRVLVDQLRDRTLHVIESHI